MALVACGRYPCFHWPHWIYGSVGGVLLVIVTLVGLRLAPHAGDVSQLQRGWFDRGFVTQPADRRFLGPFTRNRWAAPKIDIANFVAKFLLAGAVAMFTQRTLMLSIVFAVVACTLFGMGIRFRAYESPRVNVLLSAGRFVGAWTCVCGVIVVLVNNEDQILPAVLVYVHVLCRCIHTHTRTA